MYNDLKLMVNNQYLDYQINIDNKDLMIKCQNINHKNLEIYYDNNIYIIENKCIDNNKNKVKINLTKKEQKELILPIKLKSTYLVKTVYKYVNELIDKNKLIEEIKLFRDYNICEINKKDINKLIVKLKRNEEDIEELIINNQNGYRSEHAKSINILINNNIYQKIVENMTIHELMLLITWYISMNKTPAIDNDIFNELIKDAINSPNSLENVWRLAMNYDETGFNYDMIDKFFIEKEDAYYLAEYISGVFQVNQEKITNMLIKQNNKEFISEFLSKYLTSSHLEEKYINQLKNKLKEI